MQLTDRERTALDNDAAKVVQLRSFMNRRDVPSPSDSIDEWFGYILEMRMILGNFSNVLSLAACLMAKAYLESQLPMRPFDVSVMPQGAPGLDFDELTIDGKRVVGELRTTVPYLVDKFGAQQKTSLKKDFAKLQSADADYKFLFVTDVSAARELKRAFSSELEGLQIVCLVSDDYVAKELRGSNRSRTMSRFDVAATGVVARLQT